MKALSISGDRRDARLLQLLSEDRFPEIRMPSTEQRDLRTLLRDRDQWVRMRTRLQHILQAIAKRDILTPNRLLSGKVNIWLTATRWRRTFA